MFRVANPLTTGGCLGLVLAVAGACVRPYAAPGVTGLPRRFTPVEWVAQGAIAPSVTDPPRELCAQRLRDPRDGTELLLRRSETRSERTNEGGVTTAQYRAVGDYEVLTSGRYGLSSEQWLRVECGSWRPVAVVSWSR
jgi:hypothetical protein